MPRQKRHVLFGQGELARSLIRELNEADGPDGNERTHASSHALKGMMFETGRWAPKSAYAFRNPCVFIESRGVRSSVDKFGSLVWSQRTGKFGTLMTSAQILLYVVLHTRFAK